MVKIETDVNPSDPLTKPWTFKRTQELCKHVGVENEEKPSTDGTGVTGHGILASTQLKWCNSLL